MRVLVTGGAGFIGSHFIRSWLAAHPGDEVVNLDALTYAGSPARLEDIGRQPGYAFRRGDITTLESVQAALEGCALVVHLAAETHVDRSITNAAPFLRTNVEGTFLLLDQAQRAGVQRFVHVSTDEVYGPILAGAVAEEAPFAPHSPYAASKAAGDLLAQAYGWTHKLPVLIVRPTNVYGPWQFPEKLIPLAIARALEGQRVPVYGDGQQQRMWLHVKDLCEAIQVVIAQGEAGEAYNVGSGHEQTNLTTVRQVLAALGVSPELIEFVADRPAHDRRYAMNDAKLRRLGWQPRMPWAEGLSATVTWYRTHQAWWQPLAQRLREDSYHWLNRTSGTGAARCAQPAG